MIDVVAEAGIVDDDGDPIDVTKASLTPDEAGTVEIGAVQARALVTGDERYVTYHRAESFSGKATIAYTVSDGHDDFTGTITLTVEARNHAPVAVDDVATTAAGQPVTVDVVGNDTDSDGDDLRLVSASAAQGKVEVREGKVVYTPDAKAAAGDDHRHLRRHRRSRSRPPARSRSGSSPVRRSTGRRSPTPTSPTPAPGSRSPSTCSPTTPTPTATTSSWSPSAAPPTARSRSSTTRSSTPPTRAGPATTP